MPDQIDFWKFIAGLGIFLFGMHHLESALKSLAGRSFKLFLKRHTNNPLKAILSGTFVTAVLQSSSVVSLITLAFVGAGIIHMKNALGIIFGSNLGTTFTGWIVALIGFKLNIEEISLPMIGIGGIVLVVLRKYQSIATYGLLLISFGFLFLGLDYMKTSVAYLADNFDLAVIANYRPWVFLVVGFVFTAIVQSSSAAMVITLSALASGIIPFASAAAMVIGADLGTTITALIGGMPGVAAKKRVALGHFLFNLTTDLVAFIMLGWLIVFIQEVLGVKDELVGLVLFHSTFNLLGILLFVPFINYFATFLNSCFEDRGSSEGKYIHEVTFEIHDVAIEALMRESNHLLLEVISLIRTPFETEQRWQGLLKNGSDFKDKYHRIKRLEGEMFNFYNSLQKEPLNAQESSILNQMILTIRYALHAAKGLKDIAPDIEEFRNSSKKPLMELFDMFDRQNSELLKQIREIVEDQDASIAFEDLAQLLADIQSGYDELFGHMTKGDENGHNLDELEVSTVLTLNREFYSSYKSLIMAAASLLLSPDKSREFNSLPVHK